MNLCLFAWEWSEPLLLWNQGRKTFPYSTAKLVGQRNGSYVLLLDVWQEMYARGRIWCGKQFQKVNQKETHVQYKTQGALSIFYTSVELSVKK